MSLIKDNEKMIENNIIGTLTNCATNEKTELDFDYEIYASNSYVESGGRYFKIIVRLFPPPEDLIGYIGFSIDDSDLKQIAKEGWMALNCNKNEIEDHCITKIGTHYKLFFPKEEMKRVFIKEDLI